MTIFADPVTQNKKVSQHLRNTASDDKIVDLIESTRYPCLSDGEKITMTYLLENAQKTALKELITESVVSPDIAVFTPILMPLIRNLYPRLIANHLIGVQPLTTPTGYIYTLVNEWRAKPQYERVKLALYKLDQPAVENKDDDIDGETVVHKEGKYVLVTLKTGTYKNVGDTFGTYTIQEVYSNSMAYPKLLRNYSLADMTDEQRPGINYVGFSITKKPVEAKERALRSFFTIEMYQDLKSQHQILADEEILGLMTNELQTEIDAEVVNFVNTVATQLPDFDISTTQARTVAERGRELALKISAEASKIAYRTKRGAANVILCSAGVANLLASLDGYVGGPVASDLEKVGVSTGFVGTLDGRYKIVVDPYSEDEYVTILYKGEDRRDALGYFCPYVPLNFQRVTNSQNGNPGIIARVRYALTAVPGIKVPEDTDRAAQYASTFSVRGIY